MSYTLYVTTWPELDRYRVGEPGRGYLECLRHGQLITNAMHDGKLPHIRFISIRPGEPDAPLWESGFLPGDVFDSGPEAVYACAYIAGISSSGGPSLIPEDRSLIALWLRFNARFLVERGVLEELDGNRLRLRRMPERNDLAIPVVDEAQKVFGKAAENH